MYQVIDNQTKAVVGIYKSRNRANNKADRLDNAYGAYRYLVKKI
jgi:hypothetical protein